MNVEQKVNIHNRFDVHADGNRSRRALENLLGITLSLARCGRGCVVVIRI